MRRALPLVALLLSPLAAAHGDAGAYDPLVVSLHAYLTADLRASEAAPDPGAVPFPAPAPAANAPPLRFALEAPVRFSPGSGFEVEITVRADRALVARDADGNALELVVEPGGEPTRVALPEPILAPGALATARATLQAPGAEYARGDALALAVRPLMPALTEGALSLVVGGDRPSRLDAPEMRVPSLADLELQDAPHTQFLLANETFASPAHVVHVRHAETTMTVTPNASVVVLRGEETGDDADAHAFPDADRRRAAAHAYTVNGALVRVHPGVGVVVEIGRETARILCATNCPPGGFAQTIAPGAGNAPGGGDRPSVLVPPPRDTTGIPVSADDEPKQTPLPIALVGAAVGAALALAWTRDRRK